MQICKLEVHINISADDDDDDDDGGHDDLEDIYTRFWKGASLHDIFRIYRPVLRYMCIHAYIHRLATDILILPTVLLNMRPIE